MKLRHILILSLGFGCATPSATKGGDALKPFGPAGLTTPGPARRIALLIGVERFEDDRFGALQFPQDDALALGASLSREGFDEVQVLSSNEETTRAAVLDALSGLAAKILSPEDAVLVYVSSHGTLAHPPGRPLERFLAFRDTRMNLVAETGLSVRDLLARIEALPSSRKAVVLATCHSGAGKSKLPDPLIDALSGVKAGQVPDLIYVSEAMVVVSATAFGETARESTKLGHDIYTYFFLEAFRRGDRNEDGAVTISEAHDYARERTYTFSNGTQRPTLVGTVVGADPLVLAGHRVQSPQPILFSYSPAAEGLSVVVDGQTKGHLPGGIVVQAGRRRLALIDQRSGEHVWLGDVDIAPATITDVATLIPPPPTYSAAVEGQSLVLINGSVRERSFPPLFGGGLRFRAQDLLIPGLLLETGISGATGSARLRIAQQTLPQTVTILKMSGSVGLKHTWLGIHWTPALFSGVLWGRRNIELPNTATLETLSGITFGLSLTLEREIAEKLSVGLRFEGGALAASILNRPLHPTIGVALWIGILDLKGLGL